MAYQYVDEVHAKINYNSMLDELYPNQVMDIPAHLILEKFDPIAYEVGFTDWLDSCELTLDEDEV